jgi:hypothetical protein
MTNTKQNTHNGLWSSLKGLHNLGAKLKAIFNLVRNRISVRAVTLRQWFCSLVCRYSFRSDTGGDKRKEDRGQIRLLSMLFCLLFCPFVSVNSAAFWRAEGYVDSTIPFSTTLTPLSLSHVTTLPLREFHPHNSPFPFTDTFCYIL